MNMAGAEVKPVQGLTELQAWLFGVVQHLGVGEEREVEVVHAVYDMALTLGADVEEEDARAVLRHLVSDHASNDVESFVRELNAMLWGTTAADCLGDDQ